MIYTYRCPDCGYESTSNYRGDRLQAICRGCGRTSDQRRVYGFSYKEPTQPHFNNTLGRYVTSGRDFTDGLKRASETATITTGIEHSYAPLEWGDHQGFGATAEGIAESNSVRSRRGDPLLPEIDG